VDTVHQGDWDGAKGVYHIHALDAVTQWQAVGCVSKISGVYCCPCWKRCWRSFRLWCRGFTPTTARSTSISEWRKCRTSCIKNGAVVRKRMGYGYIAGEHAEAIGKFYALQLSPYLNFHRPCGLATVSLDERGKRQRQYKTQDGRTPLEKLKSLERAEQYLKPGVRPQDERRQIAAAAAVQSAVSTSATVPLAELGGRGNDGVVESVENQRQVSTFPPGARDDDDGSLSEPRNQKKGSRPLRGLLILCAALWMPLSLRSSGTDFMRIFQLENAGSAKAT